MSAVRLKADGVLFTFCLRYHTENRIYNQKERKIHKLKTFTPTESKNRNSQHPANQ